MCISLFQLLDITRKWCIVRVLVLFYVCKYCNILHCQSVYCVLSVPQLGTQVCTTGLLWVVSCNALCISHHFLCVLCIHAFLTFTCMSCTRLHFDVDAHTHEPHAVWCRTLRLIFAVPGLRIYRAFLVLFQYFTLVWNLLDSCRISLPCRYYGASFLSKLHVVNAIMALSNPQTPTCLHTIHMLWAECSF